MSINIPLGASYVVPYDNKLSLSHLNLTQAKEDREKKIVVLEETAGTIAVFSAAGGLISAVLLVASTTAAVAGFTIAGLGLLPAGILVCVAFADPGVHYEDEMVAEQILLDLANDKLANVVCNYDISKLRRYDYIDGNGGHVLRAVLTRMSEENAVAKAQKLLFRKPEEETTADREKVLA